MSAFAHTLDAEPSSAPPVGLIVLSCDETIEPELHRHFEGHGNPIFVSRIESGLEVTPETLASMEERLTASAALLPGSASFPVVAYGCTSASSVIGSGRIAERVAAGCTTRAVTDPLRAARACAAALGVSRLALLSPYIASVNEPLRAAFARNGLATEVFGTFEEPRETCVARISTRSIIDAAVTLGRDPHVEAVFLSCTNLRTFDALPAIARAIGKPALSSNQALAWHMQALVREAEPAQPASLALG